MKNITTFIIIILTICCVFATSAQSENSIKKDKMKQLTPYKIEIAQNVLNDLQARLK